PASTTPAPDPRDQDICEAGGAGPRGDRVGVEGPEPFDPSPQLEGLSIEDIPLRARLGDPTMFDANARLWRQIRPELEELEEFMLGEPKIRQILDQTPWSANLFARRLDRVFRTPSPEEWVACWKCQGKGKTDAAPICGTCGGAGHQCE